MAEEDYRFSTRHLAPSEVIMDVLNSYGGSTLLHVGIMKTEVPVTKNLLQKGLEILCEHQPMLKMKIATEISKKGKLIKRFVLMDKFVPDVQIHHGTDQTSWVSLAESGLQTPFDASTGPLWKMIYVMYDETEELGPNTTSRASTAEVQMWRRASTSKRSRSTYARTFKFTGALLFKIHQAIADSFSMIDLLNNQLMPILTKLHNEEDDLSEFFNPLPLSPSADDTFARGEQLPWSERRSIRKKRGKSKKVAKKTKEKEQKTSEQPVIPQFVSPLFNVDGQTKRSHQTDGTSQSTSHLLQSPGQPQTLLIPFALSDALSEQIQMESLRNNVSIQEVVLAGAVITLGLISRGFHRTNAEITCSYPVDLRQLNLHAIEGDDQALGSWAGSVIQRFQPLKNLPDLDVFWYEVRKVSALLEKDCKPWNLLAVFKEVAKSPQPDKMAKLYHSYTKAQLEVSFLKVQEVAPPTRRRGSLPLPNPGVKFALDEHYYVRSLSDVSNVPLTLTVTSLNQKVMWTLAYNSKCIKRLFAVKFLDTLHLLLKNVMHPTTIKMNDVKTLPPFVKCRIKANMDAARAMVATS